MKTFNLLITKTLLICGDKYENQFVVICEIRGKLFIFSHEYVYKIGNQA